MAKFNQDISPEPVLNVSLDIFKLLQPDLLKEDELIAILTERGVAPSWLPHSRDKLVALFYNVAYPLPQRELKKNYRGSLLLKQRKRANNIKFNEPSDSQSSYTIGVVGDSSISKNSDEVKLPTERLKPPPDTISIECKTIKLISSKGSDASSNHTNNSLDNVVIKKRKLSEESADTTKNKIINQEFSKISLEEPIEKINIDDSMKDRSCTNQEYNGLKSKPPSKKVSLKRNHLFSKSPSPPKEDTNDKIVSEPEKKRKQITWP